MKMLAVFHTRTYVIQMTRVAVAPCFHAALSGAGEL